MSTAMFLKFLLVAKIINLFTKPVSDAIRHMSLLQSTLCFTTKQLFFIV
jgi:hypothetical protein